MSSKPLWKLANTHLPADKRFPEPPRSLSSLHRKVSGNMSRFMSDAPHQVLVAHIMMELCTVVSKQEKIFGRDQGIAGGGPYLACSRTISRWCCASLAFFSRRILAWIASTSVRSATPLRWKSCPIDE